MLRALVEEFGGEVEGDVEGVEVTGARLDSRAVQVGDLFCALPGTRADGGAFIEDAALNGAACVLAPAGTSHESDIPVWCHERPRDTFGAVAARLHGAAEHALHAGHECATLPRDVRTHLHDRALGKQ